MSDIVYVLKIMAITCGLIIVMQIRVGEVTLEEHATEWIHTAAPVMLLREIAEGGLSAAHDGWVKMSSSIKTKYWNSYRKESVPGQREVPVSLKRSEEFVEQEVSKLEAKKKLMEQHETAVHDRGKRVRTALGLENEEPHSLKQ